ncbi:GNAT family N-acetyltransferase [Tessaracoccus sp. OS52]|uniref:GNAT family N-acetyltransferase n=1 Tax=Tessaracoccus sp. OS52 TaxID=2886691 RepID=UPI001D126CEA|nr:GNAT family N-acetyltransferase [Tessaracoccus sp. OS52]
MSRNDLCRRPSGESLVGDIVRLDPITHEDIGDLFTVMSDAAACGGGFPFERPHAYPEETAAWVRGRLDMGTAVYAIRLSNPMFGDPGCIVGTTSLSEMDLINEKVHLGGTFIGREFWGTGINVETKLLTLQHAFEWCGFGRVKIQADINNTRSRGAITRLGAQFEGIVRRDIRRLDGTWRDTVVYSILVNDWPGVKVGLQERVAFACKRAQLPPPHLSDLQQLAVPIT